MFRRESPLGNAPLISRINKIKVLNLIWERKSISRADIAKITGLSAPTVTRIVDSLIGNEQLVVEAGRGESSGGRPPQLVELDSKSKFVIGLDLGGSMSAVLTNLDAEIISETRIPARIHEYTFETHIERIVKLVKGLITNSGIPPEKILGMGLGTGGLYNKKERRFDYCAVLDRDNVDFSCEIHKLIDIPIVFDNVTRVMALGELWYGVGERYKNFIFVNLGHGIGSGIIIDGAPFYGSSGCCGELGHIQVARDSNVRCGCGSYGCLQALASGSGIAERAVARIREGRGISKILSTYSGNLESITAETVANAAKAGDAIAREIMADAADYIGIGVAAMIDLFEPEAIILGGGLTLAGKEFLDLIRESVSKRGYKQLSSKVPIISSTHGPKATLMGAVGLVLHEILALNVEFNPARARTRQHE